MSMESAREARGEGYAGGPTGFRRLTPSLLRADRTAEGFDGLPDGVTVPGQLLAAFKAAAPRLGLSPRLVHAVDWLFRFTQPQDWGRGGRPIVWPSASMQQESLGLSPTQVKAINRSLIEAGLVTMKDSPNGKRYGVRDRAGRITEAYGGCKPKPSKFLTPAGCEGLGGDRPSEVPVCQSRQKSLKRLEASWV
jgi:replication initiation protein RepC